MLHFCLQSGCLPVPLVITWYGLCVIILLWDLPQSSLYGIDLAEAYRIWVTLSHRKVDQMLESFSAFLCAEVKQSVQCNYSLLITPLSCCSLTQWEGWAVHKLPLSGCNHLSFGQQKQAPAGLATHQAQQPGLLPPGRVPPQQGHPGPCCFSSSITKGTNLMGFDKIAVP